MADCGEEQRKLQTPVLSEIRDCVAKHFDAVAFSPEAAARPLGVLCGKEITFRMRHQTENSTGGIAEPGNVRHGTVGIHRFRQQINASWIACCFQHFIGGR